MFVLDVPFEERQVPLAFGARYIPGTGTVYVGPALPPPLARYAPLPYSWDQWRSDELSGRHAGIERPPAPDPSTGSFVLRDDQLEDVRRILLARRAGAPEFIVGSDVGVGKTPTIVSAVKRMGGVRRVLVLAPLGVLAGWRIHLEKMGDGGKEWVLLNYESNKRLLTVPPAAAAAKKARTKNLRTVQSGTSRVQWDVVITDESHRLGNPESQQTRASDRIIAGLTHSAFVIRASATAGSSPAQVSYAHRALMWATGRTPRPTISADEYVAWCEANGFTVTRNGFGNALKWEPEQESRDSELRRMNRLLFNDTERSIGLRRVPDWPSIPRFAMPVELTPDERAAYDAEWAQFTVAMKTLERARASGSSAATAKARAAARQAGAAATIRYRQKAGQVRAAGTAAFIAETIGKGRQVAVSAEYLGTVDALTEHLTKRGVKVAHFTGANRADREEQRIAYQRGQFDSIIYTPTEGFNLHAGETSVGGNSAPRVTVVAEPRWSPKYALQAEGRSHRNAQLAPVYYAFAANTVEEKVIKRMVEGMADTAKMNGDSLEPFAGIAEALGVSEVIL